MAASHSSGPMTSRRRTAGLVAFVGVLALLAAVAAPAAADPVASPRPGVTERVSVAFDGAEGNFPSFWPSMSADGRYVAFESFASNLVPDDTNDTWDVFVHDREKGVTERVSVASDGAEGNSSSRAPAISADGRYVAFTSAASNLVPYDTNGSRDVFVHDRVTRTTERVSLAFDGTEANGASFWSAVSADGRYVAFASIATNLVPEGTNVQGVYVHDRETGTTERVSVASDGAEGNWTSSNPAISADGRYVAFESFASNLVPDDTNDNWDIFVRDRQTGVTERVSVASDGTEGNGASEYWPAISADGRYVAFESIASNLVPDDTNDARDAFVHDRETGFTERVSVASDGAEGDSFTQRPALSAEGRWVAFHSFASNLVPDDTNGAGDVFVHDRQTGLTERVSLASDGTEGNRNSWFPAISADGRHVAFESFAFNLVPGDTNDARDVFVRDREPGPVVLAYTGSASEIRGKDATLSARLIAEDGSPLDGHTVTFAMGEFEAERTTDEDGAASVEMAVDHFYGPHALIVTFPGDEETFPDEEDFGAVETSVRFTVLWEHEFVDWDSVVRVNTVLSELQFEAPGDVSEVKTDPDMRVETLPTGDTQIRVEFHEDDLTVVGRFVLEREAFAALVRTPSLAYVLAGTPWL